MTVLPSLKLQAYHKMGCSLNKLFLVFAGPLILVKVLIKVSELKDKKLL